MSKTTTVSIIVLATFAANLISAVALAQGETVAPISVAQQMQLPQPDIAQGKQNELRPDVAAKQEKVECAECGMAPCGEWK